MKYGNFLENNLVDRYKNDYLKYNLIKKKINNLKKKWVNNRNIRFDHIFNEEKDSVGHTSISDFDKSLENRPSQNELELNDLLDYLSKENTRIVNIVKTQFENISLLNIEINNLIYSQSESQKNDLLEVEDKVKEFINLILDLEVYIQHN